MIAKETRNDPAVMIALLEWFANILSLSWTMELSREPIHLTELGCPNFRTRGDLTANLKSARFSQP
jgi:hypothetical protein